MDYFTNYLLPGARGKKQPESAAAGFRGYSRERLLRKKLIMRLKHATLLVLISCLHVFASGHAQRISLSVRNSSMLEVMDQIEKQTGYSFWLQTDLLKDKARVSVRVRNGSLTAVLDQLFIKHGLRYTIIDKTIVVMPASQKSSGVLREQVPAGQLENRPLAERIQWPERIGKEERKVELIRPAEQEVKGRVLDESGVGLPGVSVMVKGTQRGISTDKEGQFALSVPGESAVLVFSFVGYVTQEIAVGSRTSIGIVIEVDQKTLEEVVVVGYGTQRKADLIGSVSQVNAEQINTRSVPQLSQALTGLMPGVTVIQRSGQPGASGGEIQIRGVGSFGAGTGALILVDGIPVNSMNDVDANDVASISVLKDASSAAIYGSRAANGVILITTKIGGEKDRLKINYNGYVGSQRPTAFPDFVNSWEYAIAMNEAIPGAYTDEQIQLFRSGTNPDLYPNESQTKALIKKQAPQTAHNVNISNQTKSGQYSLSFGYMSQGGIVEKNRFNRYNTRLNLVSNLSDKLTLTSRFSAVKTENKEPAIPATVDVDNMLFLIQQAIRYAPIFPIRMSNGDWGTGMVQNGTPYSWLKSESFYHRNNTDLGANIRLDYHVLPGLKLSAIGGYNQTDTREKQFRASQRINADVTIGPASLTQRSIQNRYGIFQGLAEYTQNFADHNLSILAGYSIEKNDNELLSGNRLGFPGNDLTQLDVGSANVQLNNGTAYEWALESYFGRLQYNFKSRYLFEGTLRYDGSSRFPKEHKYALFPSVAVGWRLSREGFMQGISWMQDLKLKASYGILGNQNIGTGGVNNYYPYQNILSFGNNYAFGDVISTGVARVNITDPNLRWESTRTADIGIDGSLFNGVLTFGATYYDRYTYDILVSPAASVSTVLGYGLEPQNSGKLKNKGWEFTLGHQRSKNDWYYGADLNMTIVHNEVVDLGVGNITQPNGLVGNGSNLFIGHPINMYYGYLTDGLFTNADDVASWSNQKAINPNSKPGDIRYRDISGPDGVPDGKVDATYDRVVLGSNIPKFSFGANLKARYKQFDIGVLLQGVAGVTGYLNNYAGFAFHQQGNVQRWQYDGRWSPENPDRNAVYPRMEIGGSSANTLMSDFWMLNASYFRLKNIQVGYAFQPEKLRSIGIDALRLYVNGENLLLASNYRRGWDPEVNTSGVYYPILRNYMLGLNVTF